MTARLNYCASGRHVLGDGDALRYRCPFCERERRTTRRARLDCRVAVVR